MTVAAGNRLHRPVTTRTGDRLYPQATTVAVNRLHWPVTVLGPGKRLGIWVQGCSIECPGCVSRDTWPAASRRDRISVAELLSRIDGLVDRGAPDPVDGITLTGGEPFDQADMLAGLLGALRGWLDRRGAPSADLLVYTGYEESQARELAAEAFEIADAVIAGPYRAAEAGTRWWGSGNQRLITRDDHTAVRYESALREAPSELQVAVEEGQVFVIGVPGRGAMTRMESRLAEAGVRLEGVSWRP